MIKKIIRIGIISLIAAIFLGTFLFLIVKSIKTGPVYQFEKPELKTIVLKTVTNGSIIPQREIDVKSRISGILEKLFVDSGEYVEKGDLLATIEVIPDIVNLNTAQTAFKKAKISFENAKKDMDRYQYLYEQNTIAEVDYQKYLVQYELAKEDYASAENNLLLIKEGYSKKSGQVSNRVFAPVSGYILDIPLKVGTSIIESNNFNAGSTIMIIADMNRLMFEGYIVESEVNKIKIGSEINIMAAAIENKSFNGTIDYISQKGEEIEGSVKFKLRAPILLNDKDIILRAGYSANAEIILAKADNVLTVKESNLIFKDQKTYVEIKNSQGKIILKEVKTGLSDGIYIEIKEGITVKNDIKIQTLLDLTS